jgi:PncC family amidohydrolase
MRNIDLYLENTLEEPLEILVGKLLREKGLTLATAESCTGGLIGDRITDIPGSSDYYLGGVVAYAYEAKERLLGVRHETLTRCGAVSKETVLEMARGVRQALGAAISLSVSGIAGPGGGMPGKPVGLVWLGLAAPDGEWAWRCQFDGDRRQNKAASAEKGLQILVDYLRGNVHGND